MALKEIQSAIYFIYYELSVFLLAIEKLQVMPFLSLFKFPILLKIQNVFCFIYVNYQIFIVNRENANHAVKDI